MFFSAERPFKNYPSLNIPAPPPKLIFHIYCDTTFRNVGVILCAENFRFSARISSKTNRLVRKIYCDAAMVVYCVWDDKVPSD